jgi:hypothetical protein
MARDWVHNIAVIASALAYAQAEGWLADSLRKGWMSLTRAGKVIARVK